MTEKLRVRRRSETGGRPTRLNATTQDAIIRALKVGATYKDAAGAAGIDYTTFNLWLRRGETEGEGPYFNFFKAVEQAIHDTRVKFASVLASAAQGGDWRAALEYLKRRDPANWSETVNQNITGKSDIHIVWPEGTPE